MGRIVFLYEGFLDCFGRGGKLGLFFACLGGGKGGRVSLFGCGLGSRASYL